MTLPAAIAEYEAMLYAEATPAELAEGLRELLENKRTPRASGCYRPARGTYDDVDDEGEIWP